MSKERFMRTQKGFTLIEILVVVAVIGIVAAVAIPSILGWRPNYKLGQAGKDLYSTLQTARMLAVKRNINVQVIFNNVISPGFYFIDVDGSGNINQPEEIQVNLADYGYGIDFFAPVGLVTWSNIPIVGAITFAAGGGALRNGNFSANGMLTGLPGTVYLARNPAIGGQTHLVYALTVVTSGAVKMRKYNGILPYNQNNWIE